MDEKRIHCKGIFRLFGLFAGGIIASAFWGIIVGGIVMALWNWLMPGVFSLGTITYWQAFGLTFLFKLVAGGFGRPFMKPFMPPYPPQGPFAAAWRKHAMHNHTRRDCHFDDVYEDWWEKEGSKNFEDFIKHRDVKKED